MANNGVPVRLPADLAEKIRRLALKEGRTFPGQVQYMLRRALTEQQK
jgi:hypothetical protein